MRKQIFGSLMAVVTVTVAFCSCSGAESSAKEGDKTLATNETKSEKTPTSLLRYGNPIITDSAEWVLYPLAFEDIDDGRSYKSSRGENVGYWNMAFYNMKTKTTHLLSDTLKMRISDFASINILLNNENGRGRTKEKFLYYSIKKTDSNNDGLLNYEDPSTLFISDISGADFRQITPDGYHFENLQIVHDKMFIQTIIDSNKDKKFTNEDVIVPFVYYFDSHKLEPVFNADFENRAKLMFSEQWK